MTSIVNFTNFTKEFFLHLFGSTVLNNYIILMSCGRQMDNQKMLFNFSSKSFGNDCKGALSAAQPKIKSKSSSQ